MTEVLCFDVYGSTHDQSSDPVIRALEEVAGVPTPVAEEMAEMWVEHELRYSLEVTLMDPYDTWWSLTEAALEYVLDYSSVWKSVQRCPAVRTRRSRGRRLTNTIE